MLRLKYERDSLQLRQEDVAALAGLWQWQVSLIERGRLVPLPDQLERLAAVFGVDPPEELLTDLTVLRPRR